MVSAQASLPFALAVAAVRGKVGVDEFTDETVSDPVIQAMIPRTVVHQDDELYSEVKNSMPGRVTVRTKDGRELTAEVLYPKGNPSNPLTEEEFEAKYTDMAARVLGDEQAASAVRASARRLHREATWPTSHRSSVRSDRRSGKAHLRWV